MFNEDTLKVTLGALEFLRAFHRDKAPFMTDYNHEQVARLDRAIKDVQRLIKGDDIAIFWSIDDVLSLGEDNEGNQTTKISDQEARATLADVKNNHDASIGVNWDTLWDALISVKESREDGADDTPEE